MSVHFNVNNQQGTTPDDLAQKKSKQEKLIADMKNTVNEVEKSYEESKAFLETMKSCASILSPEVLPKLDELSAHLNNFELNYLSKKA